jgi:hypothetical protein
MKDFMDAGDHYREMYAENLRRSKVAMRRQVYGE